MKTRWIVLTLFLAFYTLNVSEAAEPNYPTKSIEVTVASAPGGGTDLGARAIAEKSREYLGQEFVIVNKSGGGHRVTLTLLSKSKPDGYTLGAITDSVTVLSPYIEKISYKPLDYTFLCQYGTLDFGTLSYPIRLLKRGKI
jgi:tripartite-type tricarboxylate transporter receptor subunit TctC